MTGFLLALTLASASAQGADPIRTGQMAPRIVENDLPYGTIRIYLPRDMRPGEHISGSVFATPLGGDWKDQHQNLEFLNSLSVRIGDQEIQVGDLMFQMTVPNAAVIKEDLHDGAGRIYASANIDPSPGADISDWKPTAFAEAGAPIGVRGTFDGDRNKTFATIESLTVGILAEGENECYVTAPADRQGPIRLHIEEGGRIVNQRVSIMEVTFMAPTNPTLAGKRSSIGVEISGLQGMSASLYPLVVELATDNTEAMRFAGPNPASYRLDIFPTDVVNGNVLKSVPIRALKSGSYHISGQVYAEGR